VIQILADAVRALHDPSSEWLRTYIEKHILQEELDKKDVLAPFARNGAMRYVVRRHVAERVRLLKDHIQIDLEGAANETLFNFLRDAMVKSLTERERVSVLPRVLQDQLMLGGEEISALDTNAGGVLGSLLDHLALFCSLALGSWGEK
jgi:hypothetical protein